MYKIKKHKPRKRGGAWNYPFEDMNPGSDDCFDIPLEGRNVNSVRATVFRAARSLRIKIKTQRTDDVLRVWRLT